MGLNGAREIFHFVLYYLRSGVGRITPCPPGKIVRDRYGKFVFYACKKVFFFFLVFCVSARGFLVLLSTKAHADWTFPQMFRTATDSTFRVSLYYREEQVSCVPPFAYFVDIFDGGPGSAEGGLVVKTLFHFFKGFVENRFTGLQTKRLLCTPDPSRPTV